MSLDLEPPVNPGYAATVIQVERLLPAQNADRLQLLPVMGMQAVVDLNTKVGDIGIIIPALTKLSEKFVWYNSMSTSPDSNKDKDAKGYIEHHRRVKAIKLRGNRSDAIYMPITSLRFAFKNEKDFSVWCLKVGLALKNGEVISFDKIGDEEICQKWIRPSKPQTMRVARQKIIEQYVEERMFPEHYDSMHYARVRDSLNVSTYATVTQKLHGTSIRVGHVPVLRKLSLKERIAKRLGIQVPEKEYAMVYGSHHALKGLDTGRSRHYYDHDVWADEGRLLSGLVPKNWIIYGEVVGYTGSHKPLQPHYTYDCLPGERKLYVYRIAVVNEDGVAVDLSWPAIKEWCTNNGLRHVPEMYYSQLLEIDMILTDAYKEAGGLSWMDTKYAEEGWNGTVPLSPDSPCDEGVCVRIEGLIPTILKAKSPEFVQHEEHIRSVGMYDVEEDGVEPEPVLV